jgi:murein DD-endopeptidase MepM/ murein hydrolase activator NlpD
MRARNAASPDQSDGHGADVLAVADARVVAARDDFKQPQDGHASIPLEEGNGNYVTLDLGGGRYAFYEHLAQGVRVKVGDRVKKGDVIGALGATGHVTRPHLHFHVGDANSPLAAEGLPYVLMNFLALGVYDSIEAFRNGEAWQVVSPDALKPGFTFPSPMMVVEFTEK